LSFNDKFRVDPVKYRIDLGLLDPTQPGWSGRAMNARMISLAVKCSALPVVQ
jgi:hypothetical protein